MEPATQSDCTDSPAPPHVRSQDCVSAQFQEHGGDSKTPPWTELDRETYATCEIINHDRFGGGSVIWRGISFEGRTNLHVIALTAGAVGCGFLPMQDSARLHVARVWRLWFLDDKGIHVIDWLPHYPGLNPPKQQ